MELSQQVVSLELAKRLKELGVKQESLFYYSQNGLVGGTYDVIISSSIICSAFTVAELGELLPYNCYTRKSKTNKGCFEAHIIEKGGDEVFIDENEANARAKMLIYLIENKLVEI